MQLERLKQLKVQQQSLIEKERSNRISITKAFAQPVLTPLSKQGSIIALKRAVDVGRAQRNEESLNLDDEFLVKSSHGLVGEILKFGREGLAYSCGSSKQFWTRVIEPGLEGAIGSAVLEEGEDVDDDTMDALEQVSILQRGYANSLATSSSSSTSAPSTTTVVKKSVSALAPSNVLPKELPIPEIYMRQLDATAKELLRYIQAYIERHPADLVAFQPVIDALKQVDPSTRQYLSYVGKSQGGGVAKRDSDDKAAAAGSGLSSLLIRWLRTTDSANRCKLYRLNVGDDEFFRGKTRRVHGGRSDSRSSGTSNEYLEDNHSEIVDYSLLESAEKLLISVNYNGLNSAEGGSRSSYTPANSEWFQLKLTLVNKFESNPSVLINQVDPEGKLQARIGTAIKKGTILPHQPVKASTSSSSSSQPSDRVDTLATKNLMTSRSHLTKILPNTPPIASNKYIDDCSKAATTGFVDEDLLRYKRVKVFSDAPKAQFDGRNEWFGEKAGHALALMERIERAVYNIAEGADQREYTPRVDLFSTIKLNKTVLAVVLALRNYLEASGTVCLCLVSALVSHSFKSFILESLFVYS
jgi:hypothetical protein